MRQEYVNSQPEFVNRSISQPLSEYGRHIQNRMNSLEDLRNTASTPETRIVNSSENDTNIETQEHIPGQLNFDSKSDLRGISVTDLLESEDGLLHTAHNTFSEESTVPFNTLPQNTLPPNRHLNRTNEDILGLERNERVNQNQNQRREMENNNNVLNTNHIDEQNIATVDNTQTRPINRPLIPSSSQTDSPNFPNRQREPLNNTGGLNNSYTTYHQRSESTRLPETERRQKK